MAISLVNTSSAVQNTNSTTITINVPSGVANGDVLIMVICSGTTNNWTTPSGWTSWADNVGRTVYYRIASSEPASYTVTQSGSSTSAGSILAYRNAAIDVAGSFSTNTTPSVAPSITTTANNDYVFYAIYSRTTASVTFTTPTGYTSLVSDSDATAPSYAVFYTTQATAGATGTVSSTPSTGNGASVLFSIKPFVANTNSFFLMMGA